MQVFPQWAKAHYEHDLKTDKQQVGEVLIQRPMAPHAANNAPSLTIRMQVGEVQGDAQARFEAWWAEQNADLAGVALARDEEIELQRTKASRLACWNAAWQAALTDRQSIETQLGYTLSDIHEAYSRGKRDAARQPGAVNLSKLPRYTLSAESSWSGDYIEEHTDTNGTWVKFDDVEELLDTPTQGIDLEPRPMDTAPRDGTMVRLLVQFEDHATEDTAEPAWTIGACNDDNVGEGERIGWQFAGWCWTHDHFTEGTGTPVGWLPLIDGQRDAAK